MDIQWIVKLIADGLVIPVALIGAYALIRYVPSARKYHVYTQVIMAGLTAYAVAKIVGAIYQPEELRPFEAMGVAAGASFLNNPGFPSDHALFTTAITLAVWLGAGSKRLAVVCAVLTLLVCVGRVIALVHTPLDVVGGILMACSGVMWYSSVQQYCERKCLR